MGDKTNHRRRLFSCWHGFESGGRHFFAHETRWHASRYSYDTGKFIKHHFSKGNEENKQFDPGGKGEKPPPWNAAVMVFFLSWGNFGPWEARCVYFVFFSVCAYLFVHYLLFYQVIIFSGLKNMREDADQVADVRNRRASTFLPINPLKMAKTNKYPLRSYRKCLGIDLVWFGSFATRCSLVASLC